MRRNRTLIGVGPVTALCLVLGCTSIHTAPRSDGADERRSRAPVAWGTMSPSEGCVIFREYVRTKVGFYVVVITSESQGELEVVESDGYVLEPATWVQKQDNMDELQRRSVKDKVRYVKIPYNYTPAELEAARALCRKPNLAE